MSASLPDHPGDRAELVEALPDRRLRVLWADGHESRFPFVWLRHAVFFPAMGRADQTEAEGYRLPDEPDGLALADIERDDGGLTLTWGNDGRVTRHDLAWLRAHCPSDAARRARKHRPRPWTAAVDETMPWFDYDDLATDDALLDLFLHLRDSGLARLRGMPTELESVTALGRRVGPLRATHFGVVYNVMSTPASRTGQFANIGGTASNTLGPHTDEGWRHGPPGISLFHCLESTASGGETILVDGFAAAERLRANDPDAFDFLTRVPIGFAAERNDEERFRTRGRIICIDLDGDLEGVRFSDRTLPPLDLPDTMIEPAYRAIRAFAAELTAPDLAYRHRLEPGECHIFDNHRVLHARAAFDPASGPRHMQSCVIERDEFHNRLRLLALACGRADEANLALTGGALG